METNRCLIEKGRKTSILLYAVLQITGKNGADAITAPRRDGPWCEVYDDVYRRGVPDQKAHATTSVSQSKSRMVKRRRMGF